MKRLSTLKLPQNVRFRSEVVVRDEVAVVRGRRPMWLDFTSKQKDVAAGMGLVTVGVEDVVGTGAREAPGAPQNLMGALKRQVPQPWKDEFLGEDQPIAVAEYVEEMLELHADTHEPAQVLLLILKSFPHLQITHDAAAMLIDRYTALSEERYRVGGEFKFWSSRVYPMLLYLTVGRKERDFGIQPLRAVQNYLEKAVDKGELSLNYANYLTQNLKSTVSVGKQYMWCHRTLARGGFQQVMEKHNVDDELDYKFFTMLMQHVPDFFEKFPHWQPQGMGDFLHEMRQNEVTYVLHHSYLLETSEEHPTVLSRAKHIIELLNSDDDNEVLLIPHWTLEKILYASLDRDEDLSKVVSYMASHFSKEGKVRFVYPSETVSPLLLYKSMRTDVDKDDDKILTFAKWLDKTIPPLTEHDVQKWEDEMQSARLKMLQAKFYGYPLTRVQKMLVGKGGKQYPKLLKMKSDQLTDIPQQGIIVLATDSEIQAHCRSLELPVEPQTTSGRILHPWQDKKNHQKLRIVQFIDTRGVSKGVQRAQPPLPGKYPRGKQSKKPKTNAKKTKKVEMQARGVVGSNPVLRG